MVTISVSHQQPQTSRLGYKIEPVQLLHERSDGRDLRIKGRKNYAKLIEMHHLSSSQEWQARGPWNLSPQTTLLLNKPAPDAKVPIQKELKKASLAILMFDKQKLKTKNQNQPQAQAEFSTKELKIMISQVNIHQQKVNILNIYAQTFVYI